MTITALANDAISLHYSTTPPLSPAQIQALLVQLPEWAVNSQQAIPQLQRSFAFKNFAEALHFTNTVGVLAESANHHPALLTEWGKVNVRWWTHAIGGLHHNDFIMAARTELAYLQQ